MIQDVEVRYDVEGIGIDGMHAADFDWEVTWTENTMADEWHSDIFSTRVAAKRFVQDLIESEEGNPHFGWFVRRMVQVANADFLSDLPNAQVQVIQRVRVHPYYAEDDEPAEVEVDNEPVGNTEEVYDCQPVALPGNWKPAWAR